MATLWRIIPNLMLLILLGMVVVAAFWLWHDPQILPIRQVRIEGNLRFIDKTTLEQEVSPYVSGGFFTVDVAQVHATLLANAWVKAASVKRVWPDKLHIFVQERLPLVRWQNNELMDAEGAIFPAKKMKVFAKLPIVQGPIGQSSQSLKLWLDVNNALQGLGLSVERLLLSSRHAVDIELSNGLLLRLGREQHQQRLARFVSVFDHIKTAEKKPIRSVDLRYTNGIAVGS